MTHEEPLDELAGRPLQYYSDTLRRRWYLVVVGALVGLLAAIGFLTIKPVSITATTIIELSIVTSDPFGLERAPSTLLDTGTEQYVARSQLVAEKASERLDGAVSATAIRQVSDVEVRGQGTIMAITFTDPSSDLAQSGADAVAESFLEARGEQVETRLADQRAVIEDRLRELQLEQAELLEVLEDAGDAGPAVAQAESRAELINQEIISLVGQRTGLNRVSTSGGRVLTSAEYTALNYSPSRMNVAAAGLMLGTLLGLVAAFMRQASPSRMITNQEMEELTRAPTWSLDNPKDIGAWALAADLFHGGAGPGTRSLALVTISEGINPDSITTALHDAVELESGSSISYEPVDVRNSVNQKAVTTIRHADAVVLVTKRHQARATSFRRTLDILHALGRPVIGTIILPQGQGKGSANRPKGHKARRSR